MIIGCLVISADIMSGVWEAHGLEGIPREQLDAAMIIDQSHVPLLPGASFAIGQLSKKFDVVIITARDPAWEEATLRWLNGHFGEVFQSVHFAGNMAGLTVKSKGEICVEVGAKWLIDDNPANLMTAVDKGVVGILFGEYGWHHNAPDHLVRCRDWPAVVEYFQNEV
jgi:5'(3')-deoxyribonucleotidase